MSLAPRMSALAILKNLDHGDLTLDHHMDRFHLESRFDRRDEAFVTALVYGVLRWRRRLDWLISTVSTTPLAKLDPSVINIVRMGLYQIIFMDRVPNSAAVNTSVDLTKALKKKWLTGFVNGVLRNALRRLPEIELPSSEKDPIQALSVSQSMPKWLVKRWINQFGQQDATFLCEAANRIPRLALRTNILKTDQATLISNLQTIAEVVRSSTYTPEGIVLEGLKGHLFSSPAFEKGWFQVQDEAAQAVGYLLAPKPGQTVLDACAGLGGKTAHIAALMENSGRVTAMDRDGRKLDMLDKEMQRLGITIVSRQKTDLETTNTSKAPEQFDRILVDAPCSGLGVIRRNPDAKWTRRPKDIDRCARRQMQILENIAPRLKSGGVLVYAVCSTEPEETHGVINSFLNKQANFAIDENSPEIPPSLIPLLDRRGWLKTTPHRHGTDGFFAVRLRHRKTS
jgi:16S rRNA (cytosine967-C5)-methyltransferase